MPGAKLTGHVQFEMRSLPIGGQVPYDATGIVDILALWRLGQGSEERTSLGQPGRDTSRGVRRNIRSITGADLKEKLFGPDQTLVRGAGTDLNGVLPKPRLLSQVNGPTTIREPRSHQSKPRSSFRSWCYFHSALKMFEPPPVIIVEFRRPTSRLDGMSRKKLSIAGSRHCGRHLPGKVIGNGQPDVAGWLDGQTCLHHGTPVIVMGQAVAIGFEQPVEGGLVALDPSFALPPIPWFTLGPPCCITHPEFTPTAGIGIGGSPQRSRVSIAGVRPRLLGRSLFPFRYPSGITRDLG